jgi:hypothetical protein
MYFRQRFAGRASARFVVAEYIEVFYNRQQLHSTPGYPFEALTDYRARQPLRRDNHQPRLPPDRVRAALHPPRLRLKRAYAHRGKLGDRAAAAAARVLAAEVDNPALQRLE